VTTAKPDLFDLRRMRAIALPHNGTVDDPRLVAGQRVIAPFDMFAKVMIVKSMTRHTQTP
jgi:hypothetical protein